MINPVLACEVDIKLGLPQIAPAENSGSKVNATFSIEGTIKMGDEEIILNPDDDPKNVFIVTTDLTQVEAELQEKIEEDQVNFDLILNLKKDFLVNITIEGLKAPEVVCLTDLLTVIIKEKLSNDRSFTIASFHLANDKVKKFMPLIPRLAKFTFIRDEENIDDSNFLILMLTTSTEEGNIYSNAPILPQDHDTITMLSNRIFINDVLRPSVIIGIEKEAKDKDSVNKSVKVKCIDDRAGNEMYQIYNDGKIKLNQDHNPWIDELKIQVDNVKQNLNSYIFVKANATFMDIHIDTWVNSWQEFTVDDDQMIGIKEVNTESGHKTHMEWWKWLVASIVAVITAFIGLVFGMITIIFVAVANALAAGSNPDLGDSIEGMAKDIVQWPNQKYVVLKKIESPGNIVFLITVDF